jgi:hypothetical protein
MTSTTQIPLTTLPPGSYDFGPAALADTDTHAILSVDRTVASGFNATPAAQASITIYQSNDGGTTWRLVASATLVGGSQVNPKTGLPFTASSVSVGLNPGTSRQGKANVTISGATVAVQGSLVIS